MKHVSTRTHPAVSKILQGMLLVALTSSCLLIQPKKYVAQVLDDIEARDFAKKTARSAADGVLEGVLQDSARIRALVGAIVKEAAKEGVSFVDAARDTLLNQETAMWVNDRLHSLSDTARQAVIQIIQDEQLRLGARKIVATLRDELLGYSTVEKVGVLRDSLLGAKTRHLVDALISSAVQQFADDYDTKLRHHVDDVIDKLDKTSSNKIGEVQDALQYLIGFLAVLFLLAIIVGIIIYRILKQKKDAEALSKKNARALEAVTSTIDSLPEDSYKQVAPKVQAKARQMGVNTHLDEMLDTFKLPEREKAKKMETTVSRLAEKMKSSPSLAAEIRNALGEEEAERLFKKTDTTP